MRLIASSLMAGLIVFSSVAPAFADQRGRRDHDRRDNDRRDWNDRRDDRRDNRRDDRRWDRKHDRHDRYAGRGWFDDRGSHHYWSRGHYFEPRRYSNYVVVNDYRGYRLPPPRRGEYYYRDHNSGDILLVAAATGLVLWALTN